MHMRTFLMAGGRPARVTCLWISMAVTAAIPPGVLATGEYVYVEPLPAVVEEALPEYPPEAACARLQGTVLAGETP